jgi:aarF domain-containing kinase
LFIEEVVEVAREELKLECNYELEAANQERFKMLISQDEDLSKWLNVPHVHRDLCTQQVLTTHLVQGVAIDKVASMSQETRNHVARLLLRVTMKELFEWRFMQTDPNWGNYMYDTDKNVLHLIDFGACRDYDKHFIDSYLELVWSAANRDTATLTKVSQDLKFLTGSESPAMLQAHTAAGLVVGEPFRSDEPFDFHGSNLTTRISKHGEVFAQHRKTPPPREAYSLHRKLAGAFLACIKLRAKIPCRDILVDTYKQYHRSDASSNTTAAAAVK